MSADNPHAPMGWPEPMPEIKRTTIDVHETVPQRVNAFWSCTTTLGFMKNESGQRILHQLWIDDLGMTQWRPVPMIDPNAPATRNPAVVGVVPDDAA